MLHSIHTPDLIAPAPYRRVMETSENSFDRPMKYLLYNLTDSEKKTLNQIIAVVLQVREKRRMIFTYSCDLESYFCSHKKFMSSNGFRLFPKLVLAMTESHMRQQSFCIVAPPQKLNVLV